MSKDLSKVVADMLAKPLNGKGLSSQTQSLGEELRKELRSDETIYGKFLGLLESFKNIIPEEQQRYQAALKALSTTAKLSRQEIVKALDDQVKDLRVIEKSFLPAQAAWRDELKAMEGRLQELKAEISKLREKMAQLEGEETTLLSSKASREKDLELADKTVKDLFANIGAEISALKKTLEELPAESPAAPPVVQAPPTPPLPKNDVPNRKKAGSEQQVGIQGAAVTDETKFQKKCPMCGGPFNLLELENKWQCYTCAHEEVAAD